MPPAPTLASVTADPQPSVPARGRGDAPRNNQLMFVNVFDRLQIRLVACDFCFQVGSPPAKGFSPETSLSLYKDNGCCVYQKILIIQKLLIGPLRWLGHPPPSLSMRQSFR